MQPRPRETVLMPLSAREGSCPVISLMPGERWKRRLCLVDCLGDPLDLSDWTGVSASIAWREGSLIPRIDASEAAAGILLAWASAFETMQVPIGILSGFYMRLRPPGTSEHTILAARIKGVIFDPAEDENSLAVRVEHASGDAR